MYNRHYGAYASSHIALAPHGVGMMDGLVFTVKDVFAIEGHISGAGNPDWLRTHKPSAHTAPAVQLMLQAGARLQGVTHTDELMYSLSGENTHYGTPINPKAPDCIPGGSSSGSAVAVAAGLADIALGTDTGGSVRVPASYCGIFGFRPTHGLVAMEGVIPLAPSFDTIGWFARDARMLQLAGQVLIGANESGAKAGVDPFRKIYFAEEAWALASPRFEGFPEAWLDGLTELGLQHEWTRVTEHGLQEWMDTFRIIQGSEIGRIHGSWITEAEPEFGAGIRERFEFARKHAHTDLSELLKKREQYEGMLNQLLKNDGLLMIPTTPGGAPLLGAGGPEQEEWRLGVLQLTCIAGLSGFPQVHIPLESNQSSPIGISFIAGKNQDMRLLNWISEFVQNPQIELVAHSRLES